MPKDGEANTTVTTSDTTSGTTSGTTGKGPPPKGDTTPRQLNSSSPSIPSVVTIDAPPELPKAPPGLAPEVQKLVGDVQNKKKVTW